MRTMWAIGCGKPDCDCICALHVDPGAALNMGMRAAVRQYRADRSRAAIDVGVCPECEHAVSVTMQRGML